MKAVERFSDRVENYIKYRPSYPQEILAFLKKEIGLSPSSVIADIGSGTGISSEMFLKNGNTVYAVEPNKQMREAGERLLNHYPNFHSINATAESTTLRDAGIDIIVAGQAFHWFDTVKAKIEFKRILQKNGWVVLLWNERKTDTSPFLHAYEELLHTFGTDYKEVNHVNIYGAIDRFFKKSEYKLRTFPNIQIFDYEGLKGRLLSSSYTPSSNHPEYFPMLEMLQKIFDAHHLDNTVIFEYTTKVYYGQLSPIKL
jgi:ubiquinone/menaquinone biosynthesis C-methylase UbiE